MRGTLQVTFLELFTDTVCSNGAAWAAKHYIGKGMPNWEFGFWLAQIKVVTK